MQVAVITPYCKEPLATLSRCHQSVLDQSIECTHFLVADGHARHEIESWRAVSIALDRQHCDNGNTPRGIGAVSAINQGFDAVAFLDADNWLRADHVETAILTHRRTNAPVILSDRRIVLSDGTSCAYEDDDIAAGRMADTSSFFVTREAAYLLPLWALMDPLLSPICDRVMAAACRTLGVPVARTGRATLFYESRWPEHFAAMGLTPPPDAHSTDWLGIERNYSRARMVERMGFDPFAGVRPSYFTLGPKRLVRAEQAR